MDLMGKLFYLMASYYYAKESYLLPWRFWQMEFTWPPTHQLLVVMVFTKILLRQNKLL